MFSRLALSKIISLFVAFILLTVGSPDKSRRVSDANNVIEGFEGNQVADEVDGGTISGGGQVAFPNQILRDFGVIGGGRGNSAGNLSTVGGGESNNAEGIRATIGGGANNTASRNSAVVAGGFGNTASQSYATVGGGNLNVADDMYTTISGGSGNQATGRISTIGGGTRNQARSAYATIGGGTYNIAIGGTSTIAGGIQNHAPGIGSAIGGGAGNTAAGLQSTIAGGLGNQTSDNYSVVTGGRGNLAGNGNDESDDTPYASVGGGYGNQAGGAYASVPGGYENQALGDYAFAAGNRAKIDADHPGTFLFADSSDFDFSSSAPDEFAARATGGVRFVTAIDGDGAPLAGVRLAPGSGSWETLSDQDAKTAIIPVDGGQVLDALLKVPVSTWQYVGQPGSVQHMGPMAQDFYAAFGLGQDEHYIASVDADGIALAAIQGLYQVVQEKDARIRALSADNAEQREQLEALEERVSRLEQGGSGVVPSANSALLLGITLALGIVLGRGKCIFLR
jgi:trimeric autotransporter adhesin